jgi:hypothetical protein
MTFKDVPSTVAELVLYDDGDFIDKAYNSILLRNPDFDGYNTYLSKLRKGYLTKEDVIVALRQSSEGKFKKSTLKDVDRFIEHKSTWIGRLRALFRKIYALHRTRNQELAAKRNYIPKISPSAVSDDDVIYSYNILFHRSPDSLEEIRHQQQSHTEISTMLRDFFESPEFKRKNLDVIELIQKHHQIEKGPAPSR